MTMNRRTWIESLGMGVGALAIMGKLPSTAHGQDRKSYAKPSKMKLGTVTYNLAKDWDIDTIIQNCEKTNFEGVELRTTHAHGVEVTLSKEERNDVKKRFLNSDVELMGLGSAFDYHTPDQKELRKTIEATKQYIILAHDVGATGIKVRPNGFPPNVPKEKTLEQIGKSLGEVARFGDDYGVMIRLEVHGRETCLLPNIKTMLDIADHKNVGAVWNSNSDDMAGKGFDHNFRLVEAKICQVHLKDLSNENYPYRKLFNHLQRINFDGYCMAEISSTSDPIRVMQYFRALFLAYQDLL